MRKNLLSLSIAAMIGGLGFAGVASAGVSISGTGAAAPALSTAGLTNATALTLGAGGIGHIVLVPYFSTQNGNATLLSVTNTDEVNGKAVKVRFRGAANSDDVYDFQVYLSPGDVWTGNVSQAASGKSKLITSDNTCTLPGRAAVNTEFVTDRLPPTFTDAQKAEWTREGYVEIFNMADIPPTTTQLVAGVATAGQVNPLFTAIKHVNGIAPGCPAGEPIAAALTALITDPVSEAAATLLGFATPTTGLMGSGTLINVSGASVAWGSAPTALVATTTATSGIAGRGRIVFSPQTSDTILGFNAAPGAISGLSNDPLLRNGTVAARNFDLPDLSTPYTGTAADIIGTTTITAVNGTLPSVQANQVAAAVAVTSISNEYLTDPTISAATDWTFTFPTRRYAVAVSYPAVGATGTAALFALATNAADPLGAVASNYFSTANTSLVGSLACVSTGVALPASPLSYWGRDEQRPTTTTTGFVISPGTFAAATTFSFCGESSVFNFAAAAPSSVLGANVAVTSRAPFIADGWLKLSTPGLTAAGLPLIGSSYQKATGPAVAGKSTNFGVTIDHRFTRVGGL